MKICNIEQLVKDNKLKVYNCFSQKLSHHLITNGIIPIDTYKHKTNGKIVNVFILCDTLSKMLTDWTNNKPPKKEDRDG